MVLKPQGIIPPMVTPTDDYNFKRTNQGYRLKGKIPYQEFFNGMRKYALPFPPIDSIIFYRKEQKG